MGATRPCFTKSRQPVMQEEEQCSLCRKAFPMDRSEVWESQDGEKIMLPDSSTLYAVVNTSLGELNICEECVEKDLPHFFSKDDRNEIYYQFGLALHEERKHQRAIGFLERAELNSDILLALGNAYDGIGETARAIACYRAILEEQPDHPYAKANLESITKRDASGR